MKSSEYWKERYKLIEKDAYKESMKLVSEINDNFRHTLSNIEKDIAVWYQRFADNNDISMVEAKKLIRSSELKELNWYIDEYIQKGRDNAITQLWNTELENASAKFHINRLEALKLQIQQHCETMFGNMTDGLDKTIRNIYTDGYYRSAYEVQKGFDTYFDVAKIDEKMLNMIVNKPWADDGSNFSERIWGKYRPTLVNKLHKHLADCVTRGENPNNIVSEFSKEFQSLEKSTRRLVLSEYAYFNSLSAQNSLKDLGIEEFEVVEALDGSTCSLCQDMDGKHFPMDEYEIGVTAPPFHPYCRGTTCPYFNDEFTEGEMRAARNEKGETYYTDCKNYKEWKDRFIKDNGQQSWDYYEKSTKNIVADKEQYEKYTAVLGENAPKTLEEFQKIKYNDDERWDELKSEVKGKGWLQRQLQYNYNGEDLFIPDKTIIENSRTIAGKGSKTEIGVVDKLVAKFGGKPEEWKKIVGKIESDKYVFDVHWYELDGIQYDMKLKHRGDK